MQAIRCTKLADLGIPTVRGILVALALTIPLAAVAASQDAMVEHEKSVTEGRVGDIPWVSGGVGIGEREYLQNMASDYNLKLEFAVTDGSYLADVDVRIDRVGDGTVLQAKSPGPWFMTKLPPARYRVTVSGFDRTFEASVQVPAQGMETLIFNQWTKSGVAEATPGPTY
jgi:hypothetical protein